MLNNELIEQIEWKPHLKLLADEIKQIADEENRREAFYNTIGERYKAEFINGEVFIHPPLAYEYIGYAEKVGILMHTYCLKYKTGSVYIDQLMIHLTRNSYLPDVVFFKAETSLAFTAGQMLFPAPDLVVEVLSPSTEKNDRGIKFIDYAEHGVQEYWLIDSKRQLIEQYLLKKDGYKLEYKGKAGAITSEALPDSLSKSNLFLMNRKTQKHYKKSGSSKSSNRIPSAL